MSNENTSPIVKIKRVSWFFRIIFQLFFVISPLMMITMWMTNPESFVALNGMINMSVIPDAYKATADHPSKIMHALNFSDRILGMVISIIPLAVELFITYALIKLFRLYERGEIFSLNNVRYIRNIGYALIVGEFINPIYQSLMGIVLTMRNPPGQHFFSITYGSTDFGIMLLGGLIILISWIMAEGCKLREEQQLTI